MARSPRQRTIPELIEQLRLLGHDAKIFDVKMDIHRVGSFSMKRRVRPLGNEEVDIFVSSELPDELKRELIAKEIQHLIDESSEATAVAPDELVAFLKNVVLARDSEKPAVTISSVVIPEKKQFEGVLVRAVSVVWYEMVKWLEKNWEKAHEIDSTVWEHIVAGAFKKDGFDEVIITPRSGDLGRDIIAIRSGRGCVKFIGSVKAYKPGHLVKHDDVRALLGVMSGELNVSKGILTTTSDFAPKVVTDPFIKPFLPTRLELVNGAELQKWLIDLSKK